MGKRKELNTKCQKALILLIEYKKHPERAYNLAQLPDGRPYGWEPVGESWLPIWAFQGPFVGGSSGDKRKRELSSEFGIPIEKKKHVWTSDPKKFTWVYRLACEWDEVDPLNICMKPKKMEQASLTI